jgi:alpha-amylase
MSEHNGVIMQFFHWYTPPDGTLWRRLADEAGTLAASGFSSVWLPPAYKGAAGGYDVGYGVYDLFDLGEFDQKGSVRTKYGTRDEFLEAIRRAHKEGLTVYADVVLNHKLGGDGEEEFCAIPFSPDDRHQQIGDERTIKAWTHFTFPERRGTYSQLEWHWWHFNAADHNALAEETDAVWLFEGKSFGEGVDLEKGNFDYLMGCNLDIGNPDVQTELFHWGRWFVDTTGVDGFRFDAVKHVNASFFNDWLQQLRSHCGRDLVAVGEYWSAETDALKHFLESTTGNVMLFDVPLHYNFAEASRGGRDYDLRVLLDNALVRDHPTLSVTFVNNHDSQPLQALESVVEPWFVPLAYAFILLRRDGYPCVFAADYYGAHYTDLGEDGTEQEIHIESHRWLIDLCLQARSRYAYGEQYDYFDQPSCIGWTRTGDEAHPAGLAVLMSTGDDEVKRMQTECADTRYVDVTEHVGEPVTTDSDGWADFRCQAGSVSVWVSE